MQGQVSFSHVMMLIEEDWRVALGDWYIRVQRTWANFSTGSLFKGIESPMFFPQMRRELRRRGRGVGKDID